MFIIHRDSNGQPYVEMENVRITLSERTSQDKDWAGTGRYLLIQAYKGADTKALNMGPTIPVRGAEPAEDILIATAMAIHMAIR